MECLRADGLLDRFLGIKDALRKILVGFLEPYLPLGPDVVHCFTISYNFDSFEIVRVDSTLKDAAQYFGSKELDKYGRIKVDTFRGEEIKVSSPGQIEYFWLPGRQCAHADDGLSLVETFRTREFYLYYQCMDTMFSSKYGEVDG